MSEIGIDKFTDDELVLLENAYGTSSHGQEIKRLVAEIRRLRAENERQKELLQSVVTFADEAWAKWDADEDMRVGKMLVALAGGCPGYRPETDAIHAALKS